MEKLLIKQMFMNWLKKKKIAALISYLYLITKQIHRKIHTETNKK